jgi:hypothetical protein
LQLYADDYKITGNETLQSRTQRVEKRGPCV